MPIPLPPFKAWLASNIPSVFDNTLSYYEELTKLIAYLEQVVVPAVNENEEKVEELNEAFSDLKSFVDNYFENLDVQEEINNKLDQMAEDGYFDTIISGYVDAYVAETTTRLNDIEGDITVFIGDSYGADNNSGWVKYYCQSQGLTLNTNAFNYCYGGAGFTTSGTNFKTELESANYYHTNHNNSNQVKRIVCCGGWNDRGQYTDIEGAISTFMTYAKNHFPNAKVYIGMIGNTSIIDDTAGNVHWRDWLQVQILPAYRSCTKYGATYLDGVEGIMHQDYTLFSSDYIHPTDDGYKLLGYGIFQAVTSGQYAPSLSNRYIGISSSSTYLSLDTNIDSTSNLSITVFTKDGMNYFNASGDIKFTTPVSTTNKTLSVNVATFTDDFKICRMVNQSGYLYTTVRCTLNDDSHKYGYARIQFNRSGKINFQIIFDATVTVKAFSPVNDFNAVALSNM